MKATSGPSNPVLTEEDREEIERAEAGPQTTEPERRVPRYDGSGSRYRLLVPHVIEGTPLPAGTEIGEGTDHPYEHSPSNQMEGLNEKSKRRVNEIHQKLYGKDAPWHDENHPLNRARRDNEEAAKQQAEEAKSEPVSHHQAWERGHQEYRGEPVRPPHQRAQQSLMPLSGDRSEALGPAPPLQDIGNEEVQTRTPRPLSDSMPKEGAAGGGTQAPHKR